MKDSGKIRFIDRYAGMFICFIFSLISKFIPKSKDRKIKNILLVELFEMGAAMMIYPSIKYINKKEKNANIYCLTTRSIKSSWELLDAIPEKNIFAIDDRNLFSFLISLFKNINQLRKRKIDLIIDYELFMRVPAIISFMINGKYRAGFNRYKLEGLYRGSFYDFKCAFNQNSHISKNFLSLTKTAIEFEKEYPNYKGHISASELVVPEFKSNPDLSELVKDKIRAVYPEYEYKKDRIILVSPDVGYNLQMRNYPRDLLVEAIKKIMNHYPNHLVLLVGTKENIEQCNYVHKKVNNKKCIDFCNKVPPLREFFELLKISELLISNDNGPAHFASATGTKVLALFSTDSPFVYGPLGKCAILYSFYQCSPCICAFNHKTSKCENNKCLQCIKPQQVYEMAVKLMNDDIPLRTVNGFLRYV